MSLLMQALKKAERAKQEQKDSLKQLEESSQTDADAALAAAAQATSDAQPAPKEDTAPTSDMPTLALDIPDGNNVPLPEPASPPAPESVTDFPALDLSFAEVEAPAATPAPAPTSTDTTPAAAGEPSLTLDFTALDNEPLTPDAKRVEPSLELSFTPNQEVPQTSRPTTEALLVTPDESLLSLSEPEPAPVAEKPAELAPSVPSTPSLSLELPSIIDTPEPPPPPLILSPVAEAPVAPEPREEKREPVQQPAPTPTPPVVPSPSPPVATANAPVSPAEPAASSAAAVTAAPAAAAAPPPPPDKPKSKEAPPEGKASARKLAQTIFAAKRGDGKRNPRKLIYGGLAGLVLGVVSGGAYYFWLETGTMPYPSAVIQQPHPVVEPVDPGQPASEASPAPAPTEPSPTVPPNEPQVPPTQAASPVSAAPTQPTATPAPTPVAQQPVVPAPAATSRAEPSVKPVTEGERTAKSEPAQVEPAKPAPRKNDGAAQEVIPPPAPGIRIVKGNAAPSTNPLLSRAYQAFQAGDAEQAQQLYQQALRSDPRNRDALLGMATIATQRQLPVQASAIFNRMLENDPNDAEALSGLAALQGMSDPIQHESRLKNLLAKNPNATAAHFALGNLYFRQYRWAEAQSAYFRAFSGQPDNPDYAFNLAVSLDQLGQAKLAVDYYQKALALAKNSPAAFDRLAVQNRVRELTPQPGEDSR